MTKKTFGDGKEILFFAFRLTLGSDRMSLRRMIDRIHFSPNVTFCLRPSAKDLGITRVVVVVVVVVLFHLSHFLFKRNLSEKSSSSPGIESGSFGTPAKCSINWATDTLVNLWWKINYLTWEFQKSRRRPCASPGSSFSSLDWNKNVFQVFWLKGFQMFSSLGLKFQSSPSQPFITS